MWAPQFHLHLDTEEVPKLNLGDIIDDVLIVVEASTLDIRLSRLDGGVGL